MKYLIITYLIIFIVVVYFYEKSKNESINEPLKITLTESIDPPKKIILRRMNCPDYKCENWTDEN